MESGAQRSIMIVEDETVIAMAEKRQLEKEGYKVLISSSGEDAINRICIKKEPVDLILMDIDLGPGIDGTEAAQDILKEHTIPVLFLSSHMEKEIVEKTEKITSYGYVVKNSTFTVLDASIKMAFKLFDADRKLAEKEERYRILTESMKDVIWILDVETMMFLYISPSIKFLCGFVHEEFMEMPLAGLNPETAIIVTEGIKKRAEDFLAGREEPDKYYIDELEQPCRNGSKIWTEVLSRYYFNNKTGHVEVRGATRDITKRKIAEAISHDSIEKLDSAQSMAKIGFWNMEVESKQLDWSNGLKSIFGLDTADLAPSYEEFWEYVHPDDRKEVEGHIAKQLQPLDAPSYTYEYRIITREGTTKYLVHNGRQVLNADGSIKNLYGSLQDITARRAAEEEVCRNNLELAKTVYELEAVNAELTATTEELEATNEELSATMEELESTITELEEKDRRLQEDQTFIKAIFDSIPGYLYVYDDQGNLIRWNKQHEEMTGYNAEELSTMNLSKWFDAEDIKKVSAAVAEVMEKGHGIVEADLILKDGSKMPVSSNGVKLILDGRTYFTGIGVDISERRKIEEENKRIIRELAMQLKEVHHRIKNNMNVIYGLLMLQADTNTDQLVKNALVDAAGRLHSMSVLYDKLYRSQYIGQINIREYIPALVEEIISIFPCKTKVEFVSRIDNISLNEKTISVLGILINEMITNAMKHAFNAQDEGLICISVTREEEICFVFEDNGKGLPESITMENSEGFGMQLIGMLVEQLNGTVAIERENGTRYSIFFKA